MTEQAARAEAVRLKAVVVKWGLRCSIELRSGRGSDPWAVNKKYLRMWHHTASYYTPGKSLTPCLYIVKNGRGGPNPVPGPLCNGYLGYDLVFRIICLGEANHPGLGGPITIDGVYIPKNSARKPTFGIEVEGGYQAWEEIDRLGPDMLMAMGRLDNALAEWSGRPLTSQLEHKTWAPDRKVDRKDFDVGRKRGIALTQKWHAHHTAPPEPPKPKPPEPSKPTGVKMLYLVQAAGDPKQYITDWITKRHVLREDIDVCLYVTTAHGTPLQTDGGGPIGLSAEQADVLSRIPDV